MSPARATRIKVLPEIRPNLPPEGRSPRNDGARRSSMGVTFSARERAGVEQIRFAKYTNADGKALTKRLDLEDDDKLVKLTAAQMSIGIVEVVEVADLYQFNEVLDGLRSDQALGYGIPKDGRVFAKVAIEAKLRDDEIARSRKFFEFRKAPGLMMLDADGTACDERLTPEERSEEHTSELQSP